MRILTHCDHSGFWHELSRTGHELFSVLGRWESYRKPQPENWHAVEKPDGAYDVGVATSEYGFELIRKIPIPIIYYMIDDSGEGIFPEEIERRVFAVVFRSLEVSDRWRFKDESKKRIIELGGDPEIFSGYIGDSGSVLTVGRAVPSRWSKGFMQLKAIHEAVKVTLVGAENEGFSGSIGTVPCSRLVDMYRQYKVYLNPGSILGVGAIEAMLVGMPIVTFRPINLRDLIVDGKNGFVVDTVHGALDRINALLADPSLRASLSASARRTAIRRFGISRLFEDWNALMQSAKNMWQPSTIRQTKRNLKEIQIFALRRTGHHGIIAWLSGQFSGEVFHNNNVSVALVADSDVNPTIEDLTKAFGSAARACYIFNVEDADLQESVTAINENRWRTYAGPSDRIYRILVLRDPYNMLASSLKSFGSDSIADGKIVGLWKQHAREFLGRTSYLPRDTIRLSFNSWFQSKEYRKTIAERLDLRFNDAGFGVSSGYKSGFDLESADVKSRKLMNRWELCLSDKVYCDIFKNDSELNELAEEIYGDFAKETLARIASSAPDNKC